MTHTYVGQYEWFTGEVASGGFPYWRAPGGGNLGSIDLRTLPQQAQAGGTPDGFGLFTFDSPRSHPLLHVHLGDDLDALLSSATRRALSDRLGGLTADRPRAIIRELLLHRGDPTGQTRCKPLRGNRRRGVEILLGGFPPIVRERFEESHEAWQNTIDVFREDYRRAKNVLPRAVLERAVGDRMIRMWGTMDDEKARELIPEEYRDLDGWREPETTIGDTFTDTDGTELSTHTATGPNGGFSWVQIEQNSGGTLVIGGSAIDSNELGSDTAARQMYRADSSLSSDDHYAQIEFKEAGPYNRGVFVRKEAGNSTLTYYYFDHNGTVARTFRRVGGSFTMIGTSTTVTDGDGDVLKGEADGSSITRSWNGSGQDTATDTNITGFLQTGVHNESWTTDVDNFEAADVATYTHSFVRRMRRQRRLHRLLAVLTAGGLANAAWSRLTQGL